jgi:hypothetical protein
MPVDFDGGWMMTSGTVAIAQSANDSTGATQAWNTSVRGARDASILRVDLLIPPAAQCLAFDFTFGSEEYPEFVGSFNDAFLAQVGAAPWSVAGNDISAPGNFAFGSDGSVVGVNSAFFDPGRVVIDGGWQYDGATGHLTARTPATPGPMSIILSVFDANDSVLDSGVLIDALRTTTTSCTAGAGQPPVAADDAATTAEDTPVGINVLANDSDPDGDPLTVSIAAQSANGTAVVNADKTITFTPAPDFFGTTSFTYQVNDGTGGVAGATVTVVVTPVNDAPIASAGADVQTPEGSAIQLAGSATDVDSTTLVYTWTPATGLSPSGSVAQPTFTPGDNGTNVFSLKVCDDAQPPACTNDAVTVTATNVAPTVAVTGPATVDTGTAASFDVTFTDPGALDTHVASVDWGDGSPLENLGVVTSPLAPTHTYTTGGTHIVQVCVTDDDLGQGCGSTSVTVSAACSPHTAVLTNGATETVDGAVSVTVDGTGRFGSATAPADDATFNPLGAVTAAGTTFSSNLYLGSAGQMLADTCSTIVSQTATQLVTSFQAGGLSVTLTQTLSPVGATGSALTQSYALTNDGPGTITTPIVRHIDTDLLFDNTISDRAGATADGAVLYGFDSSDSATQAPTFVGISGSLGVDSTPDGWTIQAFQFTDDIIAASGVPVALNGIVNGDADNDHFVDNPYDVTLSQQWDATIAAGATQAFATVTTFGQAPANHAPVATDDAATTDVGVDVTVDVLANDSDADGNALSVASTTPAAHGTTAITPAGIVYTPDVGFTGTDSFTYTVIDGRGGADSGTVSVNVVVPGTPVAGDDTASTDEDTPVDVVVLANDVDPNGDTLTVTNATDPPHGSTAVTPAGVVTYTPDPQFCGADSFVYTISDGTSTDTALVSVTVVCVNDAPVANAGPDRSTPEGTSIVLAGSGTDIDGPTPLTFQWTPSTNLSSADVANPTVSAPDESTTTYTLTVCDAAAPAKCSTDSVIVTITNVAPTVVPTAPVAPKVGQTTSIQVAFTDPGVLDTHTATIDWGDGVVVDLGTVTSPFTASTVFATNGARTAHVCVADNDGGSTCANTTINVSAGTVFSVADASITEPDSGKATMTFTVTASPAPTAPASVKVTTTPGTATSPADFLSVVGLNVSFLAGQTTKTFTVPVVGDLVVEPNETFTVALSAPVDGDLGDALAVGTILNGGDVCTIVGTAGNDKINGTAGNDVICGLGGNDTISGGNGNDTILGSSGDDVIRGGGGNDILRGGAGNDTLAGEAGNDTLNGDAGTDRASWANAPGAVTVDLAAGASTGWGSDGLASIESALGGSFNDTLRGSSGPNVLLGGNGNDTLTGMAGNDTLDGQAGNDTIDGGVGNDTIFGRAGNDVGNGGSGDDQVFGDAGNDRVAGNDGNDLVDGGDGVDLVNGNAGNDTVRGGAGNDNSPNGTTAGVHGGSGKNTVDGGSGLDYCSFGPSGEIRLRCERPCPPPAYSCTFCSCGRRGRSW